MAGNSPAGPPKTRRAQELPTRFMKILSIELDDILDDDMDKADKVNVSTIVGDFKIMDKATWQMPAPL